MCNLAWFWTVVGGEGIPWRGEHANSTPRTLAGTRTLVLEVWGNSDQLLHHCPPPPPFYYTVFITKNFKYCKVIFFLNQSPLLFFLFSTFVFHPLLTFLHLCQRSLWWQCHTVLRAGRVKQNPCTSGALLRRLGTLYCIGQTVQTSVS